LERTFRSFTAIILALKATILRS